MPVRKAKELGSSAQQGGFEDSPDMQALDRLARDVLKTPKSEIERREEEWQRRRPKLKEA